MMPRPSAALLLSCLAFLHLGQSAIVPVRRTVFGQASDLQTVRVKAVTKDAASSLFTKAKVSAPSLQRRQSNWWRLHCSLWGGYDPRQAWSWNYQQGYTDCNGPYQGPYTQPAPYPFYYKSSPDDVNGKGPGLSRHRYAMAKRTIHASAIMSKRADNETQDVPAAIPGFVEVATAIDYSSFARTSGGLVYTATTASNGTAFQLGTAPDGANQFNLMPIDSTDVDSAVELHVPVLHAQSQDAQDFCATFDVRPPSPLTLETCGPHDGKSQSFVWDMQSGSLTPVYAKQISSEPLVNKGFQFDLSVSASASAASATISQSSAAVNKGPSLFFVPASSYYSASEDVAHVSGVISASASLSAATNFPTALSMVEISASADKSAASLSAFLSMSL